MAGAMRFAGWLAVLAGVGAFAFMGQALADTALRTTTIQVAGHPLKVELAVTDGDRARGLMFREKLGRDDGMLFVFAEPAYQSMWMKNTLIPLSVAFVDAGGTILSIHDMQPKTLDAHMSAGPAVYAIETNLGWFARKRIGPGARITGLPPPPKR